MSANRKRLTQLMLEHPQIQDAVDALAVEHGPLLQLHAITDTDIRCTPGGRRMRRDWIVAKAPGGEAYVVRHDGGTEKLT